jgi:hypothetical protein
MNAVISFRVDPGLAEATRVSAELAGLNGSDYVREAVREKNERVMAERIARLSKRLGAGHAALNRSLDATLADGLD